MSDIKSDGIPEMKEDEELFKVPTIPTKSESADVADAENNDRFRFAERVPYTPPEWQATPPADSGFYLEVIKEGVIIKVINLNNLKNETFLSVGRFSPCEILLDHPSVSRYHCILQYGKLANRDGWFLYDLNSTHGTRLNKTPVKKLSYIKLRPGYVFQFACSTRIFSFCGKEENEEEPLKQSNESASVSSVPKIANSAEEEEASTAEEGSKFYEKDPLGSLDKYFEREGIPMNFQYAKAEKGASEWSCSIELPDMPENESMVGATGLTRKLAQFQCALLACQRLAGAGVLKTSSIWNKRATYAENDYYDSDEDTFLDRTGQIETQRAKRRKRCEGGNQNSESSASLSYNELVKSLAETEEKLKNVNSEIERLLGKNCYTDADGKVISTSTNFSTRMTLSQMRSKEKRLGEECEQLKKLVTLTKPRGLDDIFPISHPPEAAVATIEGPNNGDSVSKPVTKVGETIEPLDKKEDSEASTSCEADIKGIESEEKLSSVKNDEPKTSKESDKIITTKIVKSLKRPERIFQPAGPPPPKDNVIMPKFGLITKEEARIKAPVMAKKRQHETLSDELEEEKQVDYTDSKYSREDYATWLPPQDQSGDGKTKLNKKFEGRY